MILEFSLDPVHTFISVREAANPNRSWKHSTSPINGRDMWVQGRLFDQALETFAERLESVKLKDIKNLSFDGVFCAIVADTETRQVAIVTTFPATSRIYCARRNNTLFISDHLFSLVLVTGDLSMDDSAVYQLLITGHIMDPKTIFSGISVCRSGDIELHDKEGRFIEKITGWSNPEKYLDEQEALRGLDSSLQHVFKKRSRIDSAPTVMLSGGLDSLAMMHYAHKIYGRNLQTLTFGIKGYSTSDNSSADIAAAYWYTTHYNIWIDPLVIPKAFEDSLFAADTPHYAGALYCAIGASDDMGSIDTDCLYFGQDARLHTPVLDLPQYYAYLRTRNMKVPYWMEAWVRFVKILAATPFKGHRAARCFAKSSNPSSSLQEFFAANFIHFDKELATESFRKELVADIDVCEQDDLDRAYLNATLSWFNHQITDNINECTFPLRSAARQIDFPFYDNEFIEESAKMPVMMGRRGQITLRSRDSLPFSRKRLLSGLLKGRVPHELVFRRKFAGLPVHALITDKFFRQGKQVIIAHKHSILSSIGCKARDLMNAELRGVLESRSPGEMPNVKNFFVLLWLASCHDLVTK